MQGAPAVCRFRPTDGTLCRQACKQASLRKSLPESAAATVTASAIASFRVFKTASAAAAIPAPAAAPAAAKTAKAAAAITTAPAHALHLALPCVLPNMFGASFYARGAQRAIAYWDRLHNPFRQAMNKSQRRHGCRVFRQMRSMAQVYSVYCEHFGADDGNMPNCKARALYMAHSRPNPPGGRCPSAPAPPAPRQGAPARGAGL